ncbi:MAG: hypothetical protein JWN98_1733 [Abditibacteriota bacterium]|nr:hypothetical protein [Abditibacteriota bacterium]
MTSSMTGSLTLMPVGIDAGAPQIKIYKLGIQQNQMSGAGAQFTMGSPTIRTWHNAVQGNTYAIPTTVTSYFTGLESTTNDSVSYDPPDPNEPNADFIHPFYDPPVAIVGNGATTVTITDTPQIFMDVSESNEAYYENNVLIADVQYTSAVSASYNANFEDYLVLAYYNGFTTDYGLLNWRDNRAQKSWTLNVSSANPEGATTGTTIIPPTSVPVDTPITTPTTTARSSMDFGSATTPFQRPL